MIPIRSLKHAKTYGNNTPMNILTITCTEAAWKYEYNNIVKIAPSYRKEICAFYEIVFQFERNAPKMMMFFTILLQT